MRRKKKKNGGEEEKEKMRERDRKFPPLMLSELSYYKIH